MVSGSPDRLETAFDQCDFADGYAHGYSDARDLGEQRDLDGKSPRYREGYRDGWNDRCDDEYRDSIPTCDMERIDRLVAEGVKIRDAGELTEPDMVQLLIARVWTGDNGCQPTGRPTAAEFRAVWSEVEALRAGQLPAAETPRVNAAKRAMVERLQPGFYDDDALLYPEDSNPKGAW